MIFDMAKETVTFNAPPAVVRAYVQEWRNHAAVNKGTTPAQLAVLDDVLKLCDIALQYLEPSPAEPGNDKTK